jgi:hypothetical protein
MSWQSRMTAPGAAQRARAADDAGPAGGFRRPGQLAAVAVGDTGRNWPPHANQPGVAAIGSAVPA